LGEKVGAFIRLRPEAADLSSDQLRRHFMDAGLSIQKTPEYIVFVDDFPRTPSGKIMKGELRSRTRAMEEKT
jgi:non-ribosomal peptide synthetase component E (peptide arylation enzyme)